MNIGNFISSVLKRLHPGTRQDPARDWLMLLTFSMVALAGIIIWNVWAFRTVASGGTIGTPSTDVPSSFSQPSLDTIQAIFTSRAEEESKYVNGDYQYVDPSQ